GTYAVDVRSVQSGTFTIEIGHSGVQIIGCPMPLTVEPADTFAPACLCVAEETVAARAGEPCSFNITTKDEFGNVRNSGGARVRVVLAGPASLECSVRDNGDGTYTASC